MKIKFLGSQNKAFRDCTEGEVYEAKMQHLGDVDDYGLDVCEDNQVAFVDDIGDLVCKHISVIKQSFSVVSE